MSRLSWCVAVSSLVFAVACGGKDPQPSETPASAVTDVPPPTMATGAPAAASDTMAGTGSSSGPSVESTGTPGSSTTVTTPSTVALSDEQIVEVVRVANTGEVEQGKLAQQKAKDAKVKKFAQTMVKHHTEANTQSAALAKKNKWTPAESSVSTSVKADGESAKEQLKSATPTEFDKVYIDAQVKGHQAVLDVVDQKLVTNAKNDDLKTWLEGLRSKVAAHLKEAQDIQASLK